MLGKPLGMLVPQQTGLPVPANWALINTPANVQFGNVVAASTTLIGAVKALRLRVGSTTITLPSTASLTPLASAKIIVDIQNNGTANFKVGVMFFITHNGGTSLYSNASSANCNALRGDGNAANNASSNLFYFPSRTISPGAANALLDVESGTFIIDPTLGTYFVTVYIFSIP